MPLPSNYQGERPLGPLEPQLFLLDCLEDFKPKFLAKTTMANKAADAAIGSAKSGLAISLGGILLGLFVAVGSWLSSFGSTSSHLALIATKTGLG